MCAGLYALTLTFQPALLPLESACGVCCVTEAPGRAATEAVPLYVTLDERVHLAFWAFGQIDFI